jgi:ERCC4-type nuclease
MIIIQDTREKYPWDFSFYGTETKIKGLKTGDYSVAGMENILCIERKRNLAEVSINLGSKWKQFSAELLRMCIFPHKIIILEFGEEKLDSFPIGSGIPENKWNKIRMSPGFLKKQLYSIKDTYDIDIIFSPTKEQAEQQAYQFLKESYEKETKGR